MSTRPDQRFRFRRRRTEPSAGTARGHWAQGMYAAVHPYSSTFLRPFAPDPLQALPGSYGRSDSCPPGSSAFLRHELRLLHEQVSLIHAPGLLTIPSPTTCGCCLSSGHATHRRIAPRFHPTTGSSPNGNSGLRHSLAGSPHLTGRIEFLIVRTGRSPPAAPHPVSPRRSCRRLQVTLTWRGLSPLQPCALSGALAVNLVDHVKFGLGCIFHEVVDRPLSLPTHEMHARIDDETDSAPHFVGQAAELRVRVL